MVRDEESDEADHRGSRAADAVAEEAFEENAEQNRTPADEDGGGIEIGHRRPAFQIHARDQTGGMNHEGRRAKGQRRNGRASAVQPSHEAQARMKIRT